MRESKKTEKMHLPQDSTELWLKAQTPSEVGRKHRGPPEDAYEAWMEKRVGTPQKRRKAAE